MSDLPDPSPTLRSDSAQTVRINPLTMFRLGLFQMGLGMLSLLTLGVLNQVLISELKIPATIAGFTIAMYQFVAPARVWFGQLSDAKPILGYHRTGYIWSGLVLQMICLILAVQVVWQLGTSTAAGWTIASTGWASLLALMFALYGVCISASSTTFMALLVDVSEEDNRSKLVGIVWSMLMVGIVIGAIASEKMLAGLTAETLQPTINRLFIVVSAVVVGLGILATFGIEKRYSRYSRRSMLSDRGNIPGDRSGSSSREDQITLGTALTILTANPQTGLFFTFLLVMTISLFLQQPVLEPYAREVFGMTIGESAGLNKFWGYGILIGMSITGFVIVPRLGKQTTARLGCLSTAACFGLVILAGLTRDPTLLKSSIVLFGLTSGVLTNGAVSLMLDLTAAETAGTFVGAWGLAQAVAQATATVAGGALLDLGRQLFDQPVLAFGLVFACQSVGMLLAVAMLNRVSVQEFRLTANQTIARVLHSEIE